MDRWQDADDAALIAAIARGGDDAFGEVHRRHAGHCHALAGRLLRERAAAEEVVQEVFVRLWVHPERYQPGRGPLRAFLVLQVHARTLDLLRSDSARARRERLEHIATATPAPDVDAEVIDLVDASAVRRALGRLPEVQRAALDLVFLGGHSHAEAAALLQVPLGTVKSRVRNGMQRLSAMLEPTQDG